MPNNNKRDEAKEEKSVAAGVGSAPASAEAVKLTENQRTALAHALSRIAAETAPSVDYSNDKGFQADHSDPRVGRLLIMEALGTGNHYFYYGLLRQLASACSTGPEIDKIQTNFMLSIITSPNPKDIFATLLKAQIAAVHNAAMNCVGKVLDAHSHQLLDSAERAANKLLRTYVMLLDALARLQGGAEPTVSVGTVNVVQGSQAIVGAVTQNEAPRESAHNRPPAAASPALPEAKIAATPIKEGSPECAAVVPAERSRPRFRPPAQRRITEQNGNSAAVPAGRSRPRFRPPAQRPVTEHNGNSAAAAKHK